MVDAVTGFVVNKLGEYLVQEAALLLGVKDEVQGLKEELACIQGYLKDVEEDEDDKSNAVKAWINLVRDIAYEAEDILDSYLLKVDERRRSKRRLLDLIKKWSCIICEKTDAYNTATDIRFLKKKINNLSRKFETFCNKSIGSGKATSSKQKRLKELRRAPSVIEEERIVGVEDDAEILLAKLLDGEPRTYMISIFGTGGLGKTALARKLYNSNDVKTRFDYRGWTCVSQEYETRDLLQSIIKSFRGLPKDELERIERMMEDDLERYLRGFLEAKRYLVVVDDVWNKEAWESLKRAFPQNSNGSRVIMTTRSEAVAKGADERVYAHKLRFLTFEESWKLFREKAFKDHKAFDGDLEELGRDMVQKCCGLPLAIVVLAGILSRKRDNEWFAVRDHLWRHLRDDSIHISSVLDLSFKDLHHELKLCFLYLSTFPEDFEINVQRLIRLIVAEGFIQEDEEVLEDVAERYIHELIDKSLVQAQSRKRGKVTTCLVHDLLRDLSVKKAKELNFIHVYNGSARAPSPTCRRAVGHRPINRYFSESNLNTQMRSLLIFGGDSTMHDSTIGWEKLKLLRVLDLKYCILDRYKLGEGIKELIHLRYLGIASEYLDNLLAYFSNLRRLQTLEVSGGVFTQTIDLRELTSLRHIFGIFRGDLLIGDTTNLQTLKEITSLTWSKLDKEKLINLRELSIYGLEDTNSCVEMGSLSKLVNLRELRAHTFSFKFSSAELAPSLESLTLVLSKLEDDPILVLEKLPRLEDLRLLVNGDYLTKKLICSAKGFTRLKTLCIGIGGLEEVHVEDGAMPNLVKWLHGPWNTNDSPTFMVPERLKAVIRTSL